MSEHTLTWALGLIAAIVTVLATALATRVRLLPDVIDISFIPVGSGVLNLAFALYGALHGFPPERVGRLALLGTLLGGLITAAGLVLALALAEM